MAADLNRMFGSIVMEDSQAEKVDQIREAAKGFASLVTSLTSVSREQSLFLTNLETATMYAVKAVAYS